MKIEKVKIQNFRGYKNATIHLGDLNLFVGKNDVGKSTVLEALDIFFNYKDARKKIEAGDRYIHASDKSTVMISVCFSNFKKEKEIIIDSTNQTTLRDEYLLNCDGQLEIIKKYSGINRMDEKTFIYANHPTAEGAKDLLLKKQEVLQKIVVDKGYDCEDGRKNADLRKAIRKNYTETELELQEIEIPVDKEDAKKIKDELFKYLPIYALFQSDRENSDGDTEVQDPIKLAIKEILSDEKLQKELENIATEVKKKTEEITKKTLDHLEKMNSKIAKQLKVNIPETKSLKWADVFRGIKISSDDNIPLNKRGSGVKRLVLLSFFKAQAERKKTDDKNTIIYAIEEPETSQHLEHQELLIKALKDISSNGNQVFLTTHSTQIVKAIFNKNGELEKNHTIIHIKKDEKEQKIEDEKEIKTYLNYLSANEINHVVFNIYEEAFHNELYGFLQETERYLETKTQFDELLEKKTKLWQRVDDKGNKKGKSSEVSLQEYIRHSIHHPENRENEKYTSEELAQSIKEMYDLLKKITTKTKK